MWKRADLKRNAKFKLSRYYWTAILVSFVYSFIGRWGDPDISVILNTDMFQKLPFQEFYKIQLPASIDEWKAIFMEVYLTFEAYVREYLKSMEIPGFEYSYEITSSLLLIILLTALLSILVVLLIRIFLINPIYVGMMRFYILSSDRRTSPGELVFAFKKGRYMNVVKIMFQKQLFVFLWSLLFFIPGLIKSYEYMMVPYIIAEDPEMVSHDVFYLSKQLMKGDKFKAFVLGVSFINWFLLPSFLMSIFSAFGQFNLSFMVSSAFSLFIAPYIEATFVEFFFAMKAKVYYSNSFDRTI